MKDLIIHNILLMLIVISVLGCTPVKRTASTEIRTKADYSEITNELKTQRTQLDKVAETMSKTKEQIAEWLNENVNYEEQKYDSLGRLISTIKQTTSRNGGTTTVKQGDTYIYEGVTVQQVDSIVSEQMKRLRAELKVKNVEKVEPKSIRVLRRIMLWVLPVLLVFWVLYTIYDIWDMRDRPNLWRKFVEWVKGLFNKR